MKKTFLSVLFAIIIAGFVSAKSDDFKFGRDSRGNRYVKGQLIVKLVSQVNIGAVDNMSSRSSTPSAYFGIPSLDGKLQPLGAIRAKKSFAGAANSFKKNQRDALLSKSSVELERYYKIEFDINAQLEKIKEMLEKDPNIEHAEYSYVYETTAIPNDNLYGELQHLPQVKAPEAWNIHKGEKGPEVIIGIHDSGCQWDHPDLFSNLKINENEWTHRNKPLFIQQNGRKIINPEAVDGIDNDGNGYIDDVIGYNFYTNDGSQPNDPYGSPLNGHGTHVSGIAAGVTNNGTGISSLSWNVKFLPVKHGDNNEGNSVYNVEDGLYYLAGAGVDIINMSWGGDAYSEMMVDLFNYLNDKGILLISSAGNGNNEIAEFPNSYPNIISVASVASNDTRAYYSTYGVQTDICAPGGSKTVDGGIKSTLPPDTYGKFQGTSMSSPLVAALAALIKSYHPDWSPYQISKQIIGTADNIDAVNPGFEGKLGSGRINAFRALTESGVTVSSLPRIGCLFSNSTNQNGSTTLNPGDKINLKCKIRNYNMFYESGNIVFRLISNNPDIAVINSVVYKNIKADDLTDLTGLSAQIRKGAKPLISTATVRVEKIDGTVLTSFPVEFNVAGGILVYEFTPNSPHQSGTFIANELSEKGLDVIYTNKLPQSFAGFKAVFLSLGNYSEDPYFVVEANMFGMVGSYLMNGGKLFIDASTFFSTQVIGNVEPMELRGLFGISNAISTPNTVIPFVNVKGASGSLAAGMTFTSTSQPLGYMIEKFVPESMYGGKAMLNEQSFGTVGIQTSGFFGQKVVLMSFALSGYNDNGCPSTNEVLLDKITDFFGLLKPLKISMPSEFNICKGSGIILKPADAFDCASNSMKNITLTGGSGNYSVNWHPVTNLANANTLNPAVLNLFFSNIYTLTVTDNITGERQDITTNVIVNPEPDLDVKSIAREKINITRDINSYINNPNNGYTYNWYKESTANPISPAAASAWNVPAGITKLYVEAENEYGCLSYLKRVIVYGTNSKETIEPVAGLNGNSVLIAYPAIVNDFMNINADFGKEEFYSVKVLDLLGNQIYTGDSGNSSKYDSMINLSGLNSGAYLLIIETTGDRLVKRFIKM